jgi:hypothetical protein
VNSPICDHAISKLSKEVVCDAVAKYGSLRATVDASMPTNTAVWAMSILQYLKKPVFRNTMGGWLSANAFCNSTTFDGRRYTSKAAPEIRMSWFGLIWKNGVVVLAGKGQAQVPVVAIVHSPVSEATDSSSLFRGSGERELRSLSFSPTGRLLRTDNGIYDTGQLTKVLKVTSSEGRTPRRIEKEDIETVMSRLLLEDSRTDSEAVSSRPEIAGRVGPYNEIGLWDFQGRFIRTLVLNVAILVNTTWFSPDSHLVAVFASGGLILANTVNGAVWKTLPHPQTVENVAFVPDGCLLASSAGTQVRLWDLQTGACVERFKGSRGRIAAMALHPMDDFLWQAV